MTENQESAVLRRRSSEEVKRLVLEFEASGLSKAQFCRQHHLASSTLQRQVKRRHLNKGEAPSHRLMAVEVVSNNQNGTHRKLCGLEVVLAGGRRIEVRRDFDGATLLRLVEVLEEN
jgi:transposase-like protein